jgi:hypothetical protein
MTFGNLILRRSDTLPGLARKREDNVLEMYFLEG